VKLRRRDKPKPPGNAAELKQEFERDGLVTLEGLFDSELCDRIAAEGEEFYAGKGVDPLRAERTMNFHQESPAAREALSDPRLLGALETLLGDEPYFLQSIYFRRGSQQDAHSDYVFMSTDPVLQLCGVWIACEDVAEDAGPLFYYPGSHRIVATGIPERLSSHGDALRAEVAANEAELTERFAERRAITGESLLTCLFYEQWLGELDAELASGGYTKTVSMPKQGDCIVWHATLVHGGSPVTGGVERTRRSLVAHFLTRSVERYFDMNFPETGYSMSLEMIDQDRPADLQVLPEAPSS